MGKRGREAVVVDVVGVARVRLERGGGVGKGEAEGTACWGDGGGGAS